MVEIKTASPNSGSARKPATVSAGRRRKANRSTSKSSMRKYLPNPNSSKGKALLTGLVFMMGTPGASAGLFRSKAANISVANVPMVYPNKEDVLEKVVDNIYESSLATAKNLQEASMTDDYTSQAMVNALKISEGEATKALREMKEFMCQTPTLNSNYTTSLTQESCSEQLEFLRNSQRPNGNSKSLSSTSNRNGNFSACKFPRQRVGINAKFRAFECQSAQNELELYELGNLERLKSTEVAMNDIKLAIVSDRLRVKGELNNKAAEQNTREMLTKQAKLNTQQQQEMRENNRAQTRLNKNDEIANRLNSRVQKELNRAERVKNKENVRNAQQTLRNLQKQKMQAETNMERQNIEAKVRVAQARVLANEKISKAEAAGVGGVVGRGMAYIGGSFQGGMRAVGGAVGGGIGDLVGAAANRSGVKNAIKSVGKVGNTILVIIATMLSIYLGALRALGVPLRILKAWGIKTMKAVGKSIGYATGTVVMIPAKSSKLIGGFFSLLFKKNQRQSRVVLEEVIDENQSRPRPRLSRPGSRAVQNALNNASMGGRNITRPTNAAGRREEQNQMRAAGLPTAFSSGRSVY